MSRRGFSFRRSGLNLFDFTIDFEAVPTVFTGPTSGTATCFTIFNGPHFKKVMIYLNNYRNAGTPGQAYTFPTTYSFAPARVVDITNNACTITTSSITLPASMASALTGWIILEGY